MLKDLCQYSPLMLYLDDSEDDHILLQEVAQSAEVPIKVVGLNSFPEAIQHLSADNQPPALVLTDFHLSCHTGIDFLRWIRRAPQLSALPVIVYSDSVDTNQYVSCYQAGATCCLRKPGFAERIRGVLWAIHGCLTQKPVSFESLASLPECLLSPEAACILPLKENLEAAHLEMKMLSR